MEGKGPTQSHTSIDQNKHNPTHIHTVMKSSDCAISWYTVLLSSSSSRSCETTPNFTVGPSSMVPASGATFPERTLNSVVFPQPLAPITPTMAPGSCLWNIKWLA